MCHWYFTVKNACYAVDSGAVRDAAAHVQADERFLVCQHDLQENLIEENLMFSTVHDQPSACLRQTFRHDPSRPHVRSNINVEHAGVVNIHYNHNHTSSNNARESVGSEYSIQENDAQ